LEKELVANALKGVENYLDANFNYISTNEIPQYVDSYDLLVLSAQYAESLFLEYLTTGLFKQNATFRTVHDLEQELEKMTFSNIERRNIFVKS